MMSFLYAKVVRRKEGWFIDGSKTTHVQGKYAEPLTRLANASGVNIWIYSFPRAAQRDFDTHLADTTVKEASGYTTRAMAFELDGNRIIYAAPPTTASNAFVAAHELFHIKFGHYNRASRTKEEYEVESAAIAFCQTNGIPITAQMWHDIKVNLNGYIRSDKLNGWTPYPKAIQLRDEARSKITYRKPKGKRK